MERHAAEASRTPIILVYFFFRISDNAKVAKGVCVTHESPNILICVRSITCAKSLFSLNTHRLSPLDVFALPLSVREA